MKAKLRNVIISSLRNHKLPEVEEGIASDVGVLYVKGKIYESLSSVGMGACHTYVSLLKVACWAIYGMYIIVITNPEEDLSDKGE